MRSYCTEKSPRNINQLAWTFVVSGILVATSWWLKWRSFSDIELMVLACRLAAHDGLCFHRRQNGASNLQNADKSNKKNMCCMLHCVLNLSRIITADCVWATVSQLWMLLWRWPIEDVFFLYRLQHSLRRSCFRLCLFVTLSVCYRDY